MKLRALAVGAIVATSLVAGSAAAQGPQVELGPATFLSIDEGVTKSDNFHSKAQFPFDLGTDLDFMGRYVFAGQQGEKGSGVHIYDIAGADPKKVGFVPCAGGQNDVSVIRRGLIASGFVNSQCRAPDGNGIRLVDVSDPKKPRFLGGVAFPTGIHTITKFPGEPLLYGNSGGVGVNDGMEYVVDVSDPMKPKIVHQWAPDPFGCHDVGFSILDKRKLGFCPGQLGTQIWDVSDPIHPELISTIPTQMEFPHSAIASPDGNLLVISDENYVAHDCFSGKGPFGALYAYDISDPALPVFKGSITSTRGQSPVGNQFVGICGAHNFNFVPGTRKVVSSWYTGGTSVVDFSDPSAPKETAFYRADDSDAWSSYFYRGYVIVNDQKRGVEFLTVDGLPQPPPPPAPPGDPDKPDKPDVQCKLVTSSEKTFAKKVNKARSRRDLGTVALDKELSLVAEAHSKAMRRKNSLEHSREEWMRQRVTRWEIIGENVGRGRSVDSLHEAFMASEGHREIVVDEEYRNLGVGIAPDGDYIWITVLFEAYEDPGTTMEMPEGC